MSKKTLIVILIIVIVLLAVGLWFVFSKEGLQGGDGDTSAGNFFGNLFPFGGGDSGDRGIDNSGQDIDRGDAGSSENIAASRLRQLTTVAVTGAMATSSNKTVKVRYLERATGNIYEINLQNLEKNRLTNTTVIGVHETMWHKNGNELLLRYLNKNDVISFEQKRRTLY